MPDKTSKDHPKTVKNIKNLSGIPVCLAAAQYANRHFFVTKVHAVPVNHMRIVGTGRQALLLKIDVHPSPCTHALRFY